MSAQRQPTEGSGCAALIVLAIVVGVLVATVISIAALVDPFSSLPSVEEIWEDCREDYSEPGDECALANRFPGFWPNVVASFVYAVAAVGLLIWLALAVRELRTARAGRFSGAEAVARYAGARVTLSRAAGFTAVLAALPIIAAIA